MSDVSQGDGWWQASDGKWYPPEATAPPPPNAAAPPEKKKRRTWLWVLVGILVVAIGGCGLLIAAVDDAVDEIDERNEEALDEVSCEITGEDGVGDVEVELTAENGSSERSDYFVDFEIRDGDGAFLGDGFSGLTNVPPGESFTDTGFTTVDAPDSGLSDYRCNVIDVRRTASS